MLQDARKTFPLPGGMLHLFLSPGMPWVPSQGLGWWTEISHYFWSEVKMIWGHFWKSEPFGHACAYSTLHFLGKHWCSLNYCLTTYLIHKYQVSENVKCFWKNIAWDILKAHGRSQKRKRAMEKICRHQDDGEGPTSHKMKGRHRCPKCFCGLEGSQRGIDLLKSSLTASFSLCDGAIRAPQAVSDFLENEE